MKHILYEDLYEYKFLSDLTPSPEGAYISFAVHQADQEKNGYSSELWLLDTADGSVMPLASRGGARGAFWLDENNLLFTSGRDAKKDAEPKKKETVFYKISLDGGEAEKFLTIPERVSIVATLDENHYLVRRSHEAGEIEPEEKAKNVAEKGKNFYIFDELPFWFNGAGVTNKQRSQLMIYDLTTGELTAITPEYFQVEGTALSPDKTKILYTGAEYGQDTYGLGIAAANANADEIDDAALGFAPRGGGLYLYDIPSGETKELYYDANASFGGAAFFNDEKAFYTRMTYEFVGRNPRYHILDLTTGEDVELPFCDAAIGSTVGTDAAYGGGRSLQFYEGELYFLQTSWGHSKLVKLNVNGEMETLSDEIGAIKGFAVTKNGIFLNAMRDHLPNELYLMETVGEHKLTCFHKDYVATHEILKPEYFTYESKNGYTMEGYVIKPTGFVPGHRYPGVLEMHGGPKVVFGDVFHHEMQCLAAKGYFVFYTNPRGADGRGEDFANITGQMGYDDFDDFMEFTDEVLARYPEIDPDKIGICGGSYGGFMCNWMIGHTDRYAAAASQRSISNYFTKGLCTDIGFRHNMAQLATDPWTDFETVWEHSPLKMAPKAVTPTLFIQSDEDYRCWMSDAIQMYSALKQNGTPARMCLFHGENHELSRSGKPENRMTRLREIGGWFDQYLK